VAPNHGVIAAALLLGIALAVALPGAGLRAPEARSEAEPRALVPPDTSPAQPGPFSHLEWSAGVAAQGHSRIRHVHNHSRSRAALLQAHQFRRKRPSELCLDQFGRTPAHRHNSAVHPTKGRGEAYE
jgi:hypothetical protein